jgi:hypothetical protein
MAITLPVVRRTEHKMRVIRKAGLRSNEFTMPGLLSYASELERRDLSDRNWELVLLTATQIEALVVDPGPQLNAISLGLRLYRVWGQ